LSIPPPYDWGVKNEKRCEFGRRSPECGINHRGTESRRKAVLATDFTDDTDDWEQNSSSVKSVPSVAASGLLAWFVHRRNLRRIPSAAASSRIGKDLRVQSPKPNVQCLALDARRSALDSAIWRKPLISRIWKQKHAIAQGLVSGSAGVSPAVFGVPPKASENSIPSARRQRVRPGRSRSPGPTQLVDFPHLQTDFFSKR
jgi:hypothetical protein